MVLNPDVVVRARGVMEKCSLCVQRIQEGKLNAKKQVVRFRMEKSNSLFADMSYDAITFGDYRNKESQISKDIGNQEEAQLPFAW
ncbi:MAG: hypothetical protein U0X76_08055 [Bacteroidia bacterium]